MPGVRGPDGWFHLRDGAAKSYCWLQSSPYFGASFLFVSFWGVLGVLQSLFPSWQGLLTSGILQTAASSKPVMVLDQPQWSILRGKGSPRMAALDEGAGRERRSFPLVYWNEQSWEMR